MRLDKELIIEFLTSNVTLLRWMMANGYGDARTLQRRVDAMEDWLKNPVLLQPDADAEYAAVIEIDLNEIKEPLLACPNDPDDVKPLSAVAGAKVDEVFIGSCMTNIGHYRAASKVLESVTSIPTRLWVAPPTRMDQYQLVEEGVYAIFGKSDALRLALSLPKGCRSVAQEQKSPAVRSAWAIKPALRITRRWFPPQRAISPIA